MSLFPEATLSPIAISDGTLFFLPQLPLDLDNDTVFARLHTETDWQSQHVQLWGKKYLQPRLTAWQGDAAYRYSGLTLSPAPFTSTVAEIKRVVEALTGQGFNSVLLNLYRDERDSMGMHSDDEPELGRDPVIASVSFGATRSLVFKHKRTKESIKVPLTSGSLLIMGGSLQHDWQHGIPKTSRPCGPRINLTFRKIY